MDIIDKYAKEALTIKERAENNLSLPENLYIDDIANLWYPDNEAMSLAVMKSMTRAYLEGDLVGIEQERPRSTDPLYDFNLFIAYAPYQFSGIKYNLIFNVSDFITWLEQNNYKQRNSPKCLLNKWLNQRASKENTHHPPKIRRKRRPMQKARSNLLELVDGLLSHYEIEYYDELSSKEAWRCIVSGEYKSTEIIFTISQSQKSIQIDGKIIQKSDFFEQFRKRFETEKEAMRRQ